MEQPAIFETTRVAADTDALRAFMPLPGMGILPVNAYLIHSAEPVLVDTGLPGLAEPFVAELSSRIDLATLRWIWITHADLDHVGALEQILALAPRARIVTNYLGMGKLSLRGTLSPDRFHLVNPGQELFVGDRSLRALRPPSYDAPETMALFDASQRALFSSDCFGALLAEPADTAEAVEREALREGLVSWTCVDAPWLHSTDPAALERATATIGALGAEAVLGTHLPPARGLTPELCRWLVGARDAEPFVGPDQSALLAAMGQVA